VQTGGQIGNGSFELNDKDVEREPVAAVAARARTKANTSFFIGVNLLTPDCPA
jgi:hypothetical protein